MKNFPIVLVVVAILGAGAWMLLRPPDLPPLPSASATAPATSAPRVPPASSKLSASAVLSIDPRSVRAPDRASVRPTLYREFLGAKQLKALYDRLKATPEGQTPEGWFVLYEMLRKCATITGGDARPAWRTAPKREDFVANVPATDPQRDKRIAAFDDIEANRCAGFEGVAATRADLNRLLADAAMGGDAKARAVMIEQELWAARRASGAEGRWGRDNVTLSDAHVQSLEQILATRDPGAMVIAGRLLSNSWHDFSIRIGGADGQIAEPRALYNAWQVLACDYGYPCGTDNNRVLSECAFQGHCDAASLQDYLYYYGSSPHDSQLVSQYQAILRHAVESGDWSQVTVVRGPRPAGSPRLMFGPGR